MLNCSPRPALAAINPSSKWVFDSRGQLLLMRKRHPPTKEIRAVSFQNCAPNLSNPFVLIIRKGPPETETHCAIIRMRRPRLILRSYYFCAHYTKAIHNSTNQSMTHTYPLTFCDEYHTCYESREITGAVPYTCQWYQHVSPRVEINTSENINYFSHRRLSIEQVSSFFASCSLKALWARSLLPLLHGLQDD